MTGLTGTVTLTRLIVRRDRVRILVWILGISALVLVVASSIQGLYPTQAELARTAPSLEGNTAQIALNGPAHGLDTLGGRVTFEVWNFGLVAVALMSLLAISRHTRAEEEAGRTDLIRAAPVGHHAPTIAALAVVAAMNLAAGSAVAAGLTAQGLPATGSITLGAAVAATGIVFAGIALVAAQITDNTRVANGITGTVLAAAFALRAIGDTGDGTLSWASPLGWIQATRPYANQRWWPLALTLGATAALVAIAGAIGARRDLGAGLIQPTPGPANASPRLAGPLGLAWRLGRVSLAAWTAGMLLGGLALGTIARDVEEFIGDNQNTRDVFTQPGAGDLTDSFLATFLLLLALIGAGYALGAANRLHNEETAGRADPVLATPVVRQRWATSHLAVALAGSIIVLAAAGVGTGTTYGIATHDLGQIPRLVGAALAYVPAVWTLIGLTGALYGLAPRTLPAAWATLAGCLVIGLLGQLLDPPAWLTDLSPFHHTPRLPATDPAAPPLLALTATAIGLTTTGVAAFRHRDLA